MRDRNNVLPYLGNGVCLGAELRVIVVHEFSGIGHSSCLLLTSTSQFKLHIFCLNQN